jgi:hypothetical protein
MPSWIVWAVVSVDTQNECPGANRGDELRTTRLPADEVYGFAIADRPDDTVASAGDTEQVEGWTVRKGVRRHEAQPPIAGHRCPRFRNDVRR